MMALQNRLENSKIIDISPVLSARTAVWPGDQALQRRVSCTIESSGNIDLSAVLTTVHIGAHVDAPSHYLQKGECIASVGLGAYIGPCLVIDRPGKTLIEAKDCAPLLDHDGVTRVLFRTGSFADPQHFTTDFAAFSPDAIDWLGKAGVKLIGIDTPSFDPFESKTLPAHLALGRHGIANLEGLVLDHVKPGIYELIALPLRLEGFDASPVRAVLRPLTDRL